MSTPMRAGRRLRVLLVLFTCLCLFCLLAPRLAPHDPELVNLLAAKRPPDREYLMGTDGLGRCVFSRVLAGAGSSVFSALLIVALSMLTGCAVGLVSGYAGGLTDEILMRITDIFLAFPGIVLSVAVAGILGPGLRNAVLALAATSWTQYARLIRSYVLSIRQENYVKAAVLNGQSRCSILFRHVLPNAVRPVVVTATLHLSSAILGISGLSFLGLGATTAEWGSMIAEGRSLLQQCPWVVFWPSLAVFLVTTLFNLLGDSVRSVLDPEGSC